MRKFIFILMVILMLTEGAFCADDQSDCDVCVGIIDSGVNKISENVLDGFNYLENNKDVTDKKGHGTMIARMIIEIAPEAKIIPLKCTELNQITDNSSIITAIYKAVDDFACDVINISMGMPDSAELQKAVNYAVEHGAIVVAAVGNDGELSYKKGKIYYPAGYENVIGVGSVNDQNLVSAFSQKNKSVFIVTLGESKEYRGTSYAAAKVSGAAAIAKSFDNKVSAAAFMKYLKSAAHDGGDKGYDTSYGNGVLDFDLLKKNLKADNSVNVKQKEEQGFILYDSRKEIYVLAKDFI